MTLVIVVITNNKITTNSTVDFLYSSVEDSEGEVSEKEEVIASQDRVKEGKVGVDDSMDYFPQTPVNPSVSSSDYSEKEVQDDSDSLLNEILGL